MYTLIAKNETGAGVDYSASTIKGVLNKFDSDYNRKGWAIEIRDNTGEIVKIVKKTCK